MIVSMIFFLMVLVMFRGEARERAILAGSTSRSTDRPSLTV